MKANQRISSSTMICFMALAAGGMTTSTFGQEYILKPARTAPSGSAPGTWGTEITTATFTDFSTGTACTDDGDCEDQQECVTNMDMSKTCQLECWNYSFDGNEQSRSIFS